MMGSISFVTAGNVKDEPWLSLKREHFAGISTDRQIGPNINTDTAEIDRESVGFICLTYLDVLRGPSSFPT
jgi:hypothetical protein